MELPNNDTLAENGSEWLNKMKKVENKKTNNKFPLAIIGLVLVAAAVGGWWFYQNSKLNSKAAKPKVTNSANKKPTDDTAALTSYAKAPPGAQPANTLGSPSASVIVEEFADFQCPMCAVVHGKMKEVNALYGSRIKFVYRNFPLNEIHKNSYDASLAAEAAGFQGKERYWEMQSLLFTNQEAWGNSTNARQIFESYAQKMGLDMPKFQNDLVAITTKTRVDNDIQRGRALDITGTPTIYINGRQLAPTQMEVSAMRQLIDAELQKANSQTAPNQTASNQATSANPTANSNK